MSIFLRNPRSAGLAFAVLLLGIFLYWYAWSAAALTADEVDAYMAEMAAQPAVFESGEDRAAMRRFLESDDGRSFYTINLYAFHDRARYAPGAGQGGSGRESYDRFSAAMLPLLARRASHPVFGTDWLVGDGDWDRLVIVRYRSRRDIAEIYTDPAFAEASVHKWAAIRENDRMLAQGLHIPEAFFPAVLLALLAGYFVRTVLRVAARKARGQAEI